MNRQYGLTIVELLVALLISSFLMLGITQIYLDNRRSYAFQQGQTANLETRRYSLLLIEQEIAKAGYRRMANSDPFWVFRKQEKTIGGKTCSFAAGHTIARIDDSSFCLRYQPAAPGNDCKGDKIDNVPDTPHTDFSADPVITVFAFDKDKEELSCNGAAVISGIKDIRFEFGVIDSSLDEKEVQAYTGTPSTGQLIRAVRYSALVASAEPVTDTKASPAYEQWSAKYLGTAAEAPDKRLYSIISSTIAARNLLQ